MNMKYTAHIHCKTIHQLIRLVLDCEALLFMDIPVDKLLYNCQVYLKSDMNLLTKTTSSKIFIIIFFNSQQ